jgi:hypothetical protein
MRYGECALESHRGQRAGHVDGGFSRNLGGPFFSAYDKTGKGQAGGTKPWPDVGITYST